MSREDIEFSAQGTTLRGWFYPAETATGETPCVVLLQGFSGVKEMWLDGYAEVFAAAGLSCLIYDHPGFGASDAVPGTPRQEIDPWQQVRFAQQAITYAQSRAEVDADRIGLWGASYGGGHAYIIAATDRRVKAVVGVVPGISGSQTFRDLVPIGNRDAMEAMFAAERQAIAGGAAPTLLPVIAADPAAGAALAGDSYTFITEEAKRAPAWRNEVTLLTMEYLRGWEAGDYLPLVSPTPLLMVVADHDRLAAVEIATAAYERAAEPKKIQFLACSHYEAYTQPVFAISSGASRDWFVEHLLAKPVAR